MPVPPAVPGRGHREGGRARDRGAVQGRGPGARGASTPGTSPRATPHASWALRRRTRRSLRSRRRWPPHRSPKPRRGQPRMRTTRARRRGLSLPDLGRVALGRLGALEHAEDRFHLGVRNLRRRSARPSPAPRRAASAGSTRPSPHEPSRAWTRSARARRPRAPPRREPGGHRGPPRGPVASRRARRARPPARARSAGRPSRGRTRSTSGGAGSPAASARLAAVVLARLPRGAAAPPRARRDRPGGVEEAVRAHPQAPGACRAISARTARAVDERVGQPSSRPISAGRHVQHLPYRHATRRGGQEGVRPARGSPRSRRR